MEAAHQTSNPASAASKVPRLRWFQFSLRTLLVGMTLVSAGCGWLAWKYKRVSNER